MREMPCKWMLNAIKRIQYHKISFECLQPHTKLHMHTPVNAQHNDAHVREREREGCLKTHRIKSKQFLICKGHNLHKLHNMIGNSYIDKPIMLKVWHKLTAKASFIS